MLESSLEEKARTQSQASEMVVSHPLTVPLVVMHDIDGLSSLVHTDLGAIFGIGPSRQADPKVVVTSL